MKKAAYFSYVRKSVLRVCIEDKSASSVEEGREKFCKLNCVNKKEEKE